MTIDPRVALRNRAERLIALLDCDAPDSILGFEAWLIMRGVLALAAFYCVTNPESFALPRIATVLIGAWVFVGAAAMFVVGGRRS